MAFVKIAYNGTWHIPVNEKGEEDWMCPKCGHKHISCCGNSHFPCTKSPQYGGDCKCDYNLMPKIDLQFTIGEL